MCGIAGLLKFGRMDQTQNLVREIVDSQVHRGPDFQAVTDISLSHGTCVLGHDRLSILDLSPLGHQPMWDTSKRFALVFNGEIYNYIELRRELMALGHQFQSQTDSEVIIEAFKAWGAGAVNRFNGMFAFALLDVAAGTLWLCRDRFGVKPCYYFQNSELVAFASTPRILAQHFRMNPNIKYLSQGLHYWVYEDSSSQSQYEGIQSLPPSHMIQFQLTPAGIQFEIRRYYNVVEEVQRTRQEVAGLGEAELVHRVSDLLESAAMLRMRSDVPVGISLSGGLDSSLITSFISPRAKDLCGFCFGHPQLKHTEGPLVQLVGRRHKVHLDFVWPSPQELAATFLEAIDAQDAPFPTGSIMAQFWVFRRAQQRGFKVIMGGQGADESFMGYRKFHLFYLQRLAARRQYAKFLIAALDTFSLFFAELFQISRYWQIRDRYRASGGRAVSIFSPSPPKLQLALPSGCHPRDRQLRDITDYSLPTLLRYEDRNSMWHSIESRLPFMDYRLVQLGVALPTGLKIRNGYGKAVLRQIARNRVPELIRRARYKIGFSVQTNSWIRQGGLGDLVRGELRQHESHLRAFTTPGINFQEYFSDQQLIARPFAFAEATTLIWLGRRLSQVPSPQCTSLQTVATADR